jgi:hypothetical protein
MISRTKARELISKRYNQGVTWLGIQKELKSLGYVSQRTGKPLGIPGCKAMYHVPNRRKRKAIKEMAGPTVADQKILDVFAETDSTGHGDGLSQKSIDTLLGFTWSRVGPLTPVEVLSIIEQVIKSDMSPEAKIGLIQMAVRD